MAEPRSPAEVLIAGGGVAALATLIALRDPAVEAVDASARRVVLRSGDTIHYDPLVLAPAAAPGPALDLEVPLESIDATPVRR